MPCHSTQCLAYDQAIFKTCLSIKSQAVNLNTSDDQFVCLRVCVLFRSNLRHLVNKLHFSQEFVSSFVTFGWFIRDWNCIRYILWCTNIATCRTPLCSQLLRWCFREIVNYLPRSRCGILGFSSSGDPWRTHYQNPLNEQRPRISGDPPRKVWTPPTLQIRHQTGFIAATRTHVKISLEYQKLVPWWWQRLQTTMFWNEQVLFNIHECKS